MPEERERLKAGLRPDQKRRLESLAVQVTVKQSPQENGDKTHGRAVLPTNPKENTMPAEENVQTQQHQSRETVARIRSVDAATPAERSVLEGIAQSVLVQQDILTQLQELNKKYDAEQTFVSKAKDIGLFMGGAIIVSGAGWGIVRLFTRKKAPMPMPVEGAVRK